MFWGVTPLWSVREPALEHARHSILYAPEVARLAATHSFSSQDPVPVDQPAADSVPFMLGVVS